MKRILILSAGIGSGHNSAAGAVAESLKAADSSVGISVTDVMKDCSDRQTRLIYKYGYAASMSIIPGIYDRGYYAAQNGSEHRRENAAVLRAAEGMTQSVYKRIRDISPDVIYCTHFFPAITATILRKRYDLGFRIILSNLDYNVTPYWNSASDADIITVAHRELIPDCIRMGFDESRIAVTGIPTKEAFLLDYDKDSVRGELGLDADMFTILVMFGGAGLVYILEGMSSSLNGKKYEPLRVSAEKTGKVNTDLFTEDSMLELGYCTEVLVRLQKCKCNIDEFSIDDLIGYMNKIGNSIVAFRTGSIVKLHIHTMTPEKVLEYCRRYGEFLTVKVENMMMQHNEIIVKEQKKQKQRKKYAVAAVANGDGIRDQFREFGADIVINGGQSMNPSAGELISAFDEANADTVFILPNNGNIILSAKQAAELYKKSDVRVIPTKNIGDCYSVLSMLDLERENADDIERDMNEAMKGTVTAEISRSIRDTEMDGLSVKTGEYIGIIGKHIVSSDTDCYDTATAAIALTEPEKHSALIILEGKSADPKTTDDIRSYISEKYPKLETYINYGGQDIYDYIMVVS